MENDVIRAAVHAACVEMVRLFLNPPVADHSFSALDAEIGKIADRCVETIEKNTLKIKVSK